MHKQRLQKISINKAKWNLKTQHYFKKVNVKILILRFVTPTKYCL